MWCMSHMCVGIRMSYFLHESTSRISLSLTCCCSRFRHHFSTHPHAYMHTYLYNVRRLDYRLRFRVNYTFTVHALVSADFASRAVRTWLPHWEIKEDLEMRSPSKYEIKKTVNMITRTVYTQKYSSKSHGKRVGRFYAYESIIVIIKDI